MTSSLSVLSLLIWVLLSGVLFSANAHPSKEVELAPFKRDSPVQRRDSRRRWVPTWSSMPQLTEPANLPPPPYNTTAAQFTNATIRQSFRISKGSSQLRMRFSNAFGVNSLDITRATLALPLNGSVGTSSIRTETLQNLTFSGYLSFSVPNGALVVSDPIDLQVSDDDVVSVSMFLANGQQGQSITSHPGSRTTSYIVMGDHVDDARLDGEASVISVEHWYYISNMEVGLERGDTTSALAIVGDSLTDGRGSTENGNDRWPDQLYQRLRSSNREKSVTYLNQAAGGNRVLADGLGPNALGRLDRDVLAQAGVKWTILFEGVNDIGTADATEEAQDTVVAALIGAYLQMLVRLQSYDMKVYIATITPFGKNTYSDAGGLRERSRQKINDWIRSQKHFDAVLDFDKAVRDPGNVTVIRSDYDVGDGLHMKPIGYKAIANCIPLSLFS